MRYFVAIVDEGAFSRAAVSLGVVQPALSLHVRKMEEELGTTLLLRNAGGVTPTEAGLHLAARARGLLAEMHSLEEELVRLAPPGAPAGKAGLAIFGAVGSRVFSLTRSWPGPARLAALVGTGPTSPKPVPEAQMMAGLILDSVSQSQPRRRITPARKSSTITSDWATRS